MKPKVETRGRPPLAPEDRRSEIVTFRLTPDELRSLTEDAKERGVSLTDLICHALQKCDII
jgi:hypothetical protein